MAEGTALGLYTFNQYRTNRTDEPDNELAALEIVEQDQARLSALQDGLAKGVVLSEAVEIARGHRGEEVDPAAGSADAGRDKTAGSWRDAFLRLPHRHDALISLGLISGSFETAVTWDQFDTFQSK